MRAHGGIVSVVCLKWGLGWTGKNGYGGVVALSPPEDKLQITPFNIRQLSG